MSQIENTIKLNKPSRLKALKLDDILNRITTSKNNHFLSSYSQPSFIVGRLSDGQEICECLHEIGSIYITGKQKCGKTSFIKSIILQVQAKVDKGDVKFMLLGEEGELGSIIADQRLTSFRGRGKTEISRGLSWLISEINRRYTIFSSERSFRYREYEHIDISRISRSQTTPILLVIIENYSKLVGKFPTKQKAEIENKLIKLLQQARAVGIYLILSTSEPAGTNKSHIMFSNFHSRITFKNTNRKSSIKNFDYPGTEKLLSYCDAIFYNPILHIYLRVQTPFIDSV